MSQILNLKRAKPRDVLLKMMTYCSLKVMKRW